MNDWAFIVAILAIILSVLSFAAACGCIIYVVGLRNSTHQIEWRPLIPEKKKDAQDAPTEAQDEEDEDIDEPRTF